MQNLHLKVLAILFIAAVRGSSGSRFGLPNIIQSGRDITKGVAETVVEDTPTPSEIFEATKQALFGYPLAVVSSAINQVCAAALASDTVTPRVTPDINQMNFKLMTACRNYSYPLNNSAEMWNSEHFDASKKVVIFATGWLNTINESSRIEILKQPFFCRDDVNFIVVDAADFLDTLYTWAAFNTDEVGKYVARGVVELIKIVPLENVHLIGHSLGAHVVGAAGRYFTEFTNLTLPRITGLDPAKPCFKEGEALSGLLRGFAEFIDVVHSDPGILGIREPLGDVDFYPDGLSPIAPGTLSFFTSHGRAVEYFAETVYPGNEYNFLGVRCTSLASLRNGRCKGQKVPMGYEVPFDIKGNYFLEVNGEKPYGQELPRQEALDNEKCGVCQTNN